MSINFNPTVNTNEVYKSKVLSAQKTKTENSKEIKDSTYYVNQIKENIPKSEVNIKSMTASEVTDYYDKWKKLPVATNARIPEITISPKVLEKMKNDPNYAESMMAKIQDAGTPIGFEGAQLYEYKVFVKDDGEIEVMACADFMSGKDNKVSNDDDNEKKKKAKKELEKLQLSRYSYNDNKLKTISEEVVDKNIISNDDYLYQNAIMANIKNNLL
ncbi:hypothetical protein [Clostridium saccharoperbutylacetonicum]|uniref:hypothetical protein n=1 Tax=Clostridium saccharoperbutylacetonicum TaxID=36745 RepID=UPI0039ECC020